MPLSGTVPSAVAPSLKVTEPVGVPPAPLTVAVKTMAEATAPGFDDDVRAVVLALCTMTSANAADVLPVRFASPP